MLPLGQRRCHLPTFTCVVAKLKVSSRFGTGPTGRWASSGGFLGLAFRQPNGQIAAVLAGLVLGDQEMVSEARLKLLKQHGEESIVTVKPAAAIVERLLTA